jgi:DNA helicase-2/ATP-dependent DNA helicase PcrA
MRSLTEPDELEEERRLAYVGITRARQRLYLTHSWSRSLWGGVNYNPPSRFLKEIPEDLVKRMGEKPRRSAGGFNDSGGYSRGGYSGGGSGNRYPSRPVPTSSVRYPNMERATAGWRVGQEVSHTRWGTGVITALAGSGEKAEAKIWFSDIGEKTLLLAYAPIKPTD